MTAATGHARAARPVFRLAGWRMTLAAIGIGMALAAATVLLVAGFTSGPGDAATLWITVALWALLAGAVAGFALAIVALVLRELAYGDVPLAPLRWLLGLVAAAATAAVLAWALGPASPWVLPGAVAVGGALGWIAQRLAFATRSGS